MVRIRLKHFLCKAFFAMSCYIWAFFVVGGVRSRVMIAAEALSSYTSNDSWCNRTKFLTCRVAVDKTK